VPPELTVKDVERQVHELGFLFDRHTKLLRDHYQCLGRVSERLDQTMNMVGDLSNSVNKRFAEVNKRFDQVDQRFDQVDQRFDGVDQRLDGMDQRLDGMDQRLERIEVLLVGLVGRRPQTASDN
jgi:hypothetical protein